MDLACRCRERGKEGGREGGVDVEGLTFVFGNELLVDGGTHMRVGGRRGRRGGKRKNVMKYLCGSLYPRDKGGWYNVGGVGLAKKERATISKTER